MQNVDGLWKYYKSLGITPIFPRKIMKINEFPCVLKVKTLVEIHQDERIFCICIEQGFCVWNIFVASSSIHLIQLMPCEIKIHFLTRGKFASKNYQSFRTYWNIFLIPQNLVGEYQVHGKFPKNEKNKKTYLKIMKHWWKIQIAAANKVPFINWFGTFTVKVGPRATWDVISIIDDKIF